MERENSAKYILIYFVAIFFFAFGGVFVKYCSLPACNVAFYRMLIVLPALFPFAVKELPRLSWADLRIMLLGGLLYGVNLILWNYSMLLTTQANANLLANLHIFTTVPLSIFILKEKMQKTFLIGIAIALAGMVLLVTGKANPQSGYFLGDATAFATSLFYGSYLMTVYFVRDRVSTPTVLFVNAAGSLVLLFPAMALIEGVYFPNTWSALWPLIATTVFSHFGGIGLVNLCLGKLRASLASTLSLTQPVIGALLGLMLFGELLSLQEIAGIVVISGGVWFTQRQKAATVDDAVSSCGSAAPLVGRDDPGPPPGNAG